MESALAAREAGGSASGAPVVFFNASTRISRLSLNGAFSLLASWAIRSAGVPVQYWVCERGMELCVLGTDRVRPEAVPPCADCLEFSDVLFPTSQRIPITFSPAAAPPVGASLAEMSQWTWDGLALGTLCLPSLRWALRRHHLDDDPPTRHRMRLYLRSAASLAAQFRARLAAERPRAVVVFNGILYPEAVARAVAQGLGIPVVTHEIGLRPSSAFFSHAEATFRELPLPPDLSWADREQELLESWMAARQRGDFTMAGIQFWPRMQPLAPGRRRQMARFRQVVVVFPNVIFDTSQAQANTIFSDMFDWLDSLRPVFDTHPETLFVVRAHPDESRKGKESQESVGEWARLHGLDRQANVWFIPSEDFVSSYELMRAAKFVLTYNSSVGLEAAILRVPVVAAGRARFSHLPIVTMPSDREAYAGQVEGYLEAGAIDVPQDRAEIGKRWLYYEAYHASLDLAPFLEPDRAHPGMVRVREFDLAELETSSALRVIRRGILDREPFVQPLPARETSLPVAEEAV